MSLPNRKELMADDFPRCSDFPCLKRKYRSFKCALACAPKVGSDLNWALVWMSYNNIDPYNVKKHAAWSDELDAFAVRSLTKPTEIAKIMNLKDHDMANFPSLIAERTDRSYHCGRIPGLGLDEGDADGDGDFEINETDYEDLNSGALKYVLANQSKEDNIDQAAGGLDSYYGTPPNCEDPDRCCDSYYKSWDMGISVASYFYPLTQPNHEVYGRMFLFNLAALKDVMITNAANDRIIYSKTFPPSFKLFSEVSDVSVDDSKNQFTIHYQPNALGNLIVTPESRTISWPKYNDSGHAVSITQPGELHHDIVEFLKKNGLI